MTPKELDAAFAAITPEGAQALVGWMLQAATCQNAEVTRQLTNFHGAFSGQAWVFCQPAPTQDKSA